MVVWFPLVSICSQEGSTFTEKYRNKLNYRIGPNHQLLQLCMAHTAWSDSDQAVRAVHSCNSWFCDYFQDNICYFSKIYMLWPQNCLTERKSSSCGLQHVYAIPMPLSVSFHYFYRGRQLCNFLKVYLFI